MPKMKLSEWRQRIATLKAKGLLPAERRRAIFPAEQQLFQLDENILLRLKDQDPIMRRRAMHDVILSGSKSRVPLIEKMLDDPDVGVRSEAKHLLHLFSRKLKHHRLYLNEEPGFFDKKRNVLRKEFEKTGSGLVLLGGRLAGKAVIRIVSKSAFEAWKKAFLARKAWKAAGFDYVPVEPILMKGKRLRAFPVQSGYYYRVSTKVLLGPNRDQFLFTHPQFKRQLHDASERIWAVLKSLGIRHGHFVFNLCVEMVKGRPRLYIIDFDEAMLSKRASN